MRRLTVMASLTGLLAAFLIAVGATSAITQSALNSPPTGQG